MPTLPFSRRQFLGTMATASLAIGRDTLTGPLSLEELRAGWLHPPRSYRPHTRWWWPGGAVTKEGITWQLEQMHAQGMGGAEVMHAWRMYAKGNIPYLSDEWLEMARHAVQKARELDMEVAFTFGPGWSFGGRWVPPDQRSKVLAPAWVDVAGPGAFDAEPPKYIAPDTVRALKPEPGPDEDRIVAVIAAKRKGDGLEGNTAIDLTRFLKDGRLRWEIPEGEWRVMAFRIKYTGQQNQAQNEEQPPWVVDHMSKKAMEAYCDHLGGVLYRALGREFGRTIDSFFCDSFEILPLPNTLLWSNDTLEGFKRRKGYDLAPYLPAIWFDIGDLTPKIRYDINEYLHELGLETAFRTFVDWCAAHNVQARIQPHYRFTEELIQGAGAATRPETEVTTVRFEVVTDPRKATAAGAHFYGREIVSAEAYTFIHIEHYMTTLAEMKIAADAFLRDGVTQFYDVGYLYSPEMEVAPSRDLEWANGIFHWNTWWRYYHHLTGYNSRCCFLLRQGSFVADVLLYSPQATVWTQKVLFGMDRRVMPYGNLGKTLVANGYDFDPVNDDVLENHARIENGCIRVRDLCYRVVILPNIQALPVTTLEFLARFVRMGGALIALDGLPSSSVGMRDASANDRKVREIVKELFGSEMLGRAHGNGHTWYLPEYKVGQLVFGPGPVPYRTTPPLDAAQSRLLEILHQRVPPDFALEGDAQSDGLTFIHRRVGDLEIYFVTNLQPKRSRMAVRFRVSGKRPENWDPMSGQITPILHYRPTNSGVEVPLDLAQWGSTFIVFRPGSDATRVSRTNLEKVLDVKPTAVTGIAAADGTVFAEIVHNGLPRTAKSEVSGLPNAITLAGPWKLVLEAKRFPRLERTLDRLSNWTEDAATRHFSGTGSYELDFEMPPECIRKDLELILDLGAVGTVAEVSLNGQDVGVSWIEPYRIDITQAARAGRNRLRVLVTNTLANYVAGMKSPPDVPVELVPHYGGAFDIYPEGAKVARNELARKNLPASGLMGPVRIVPFQRVTLSLEP